MQFLPGLAIVAASTLLIYAAIALARRRAFAREHWFGVVFLIPFPCMLAVHEWLNLSDALMVEAEPGKRPAHLYNLAMAGILIGGVAGYLFHTGMLAAKSRGWLAVKLAALAAYWMLFVV